MPTYLSSAGRLTLEFRRGFYGVVDDPVMGKQTVPVKPLKVRFVELHEPFYVHGLPGKGNLARGLLTPEEGARQIRATSSELGPIGDNLPKTDKELADWIVQKMRSHSGLGSLFVEIDDASETPDGTDLEQDLEPVSSDPAPGIITQSGDHAYCKVCKKTMDKRGINGHRKSKVHLANLAEHEQERRKASGF